MPVEISTQLSDLADEFNPSSDSPKPDLDTSAPLEDGAITQVPDESMSEDVPTQDIPSYVGEYSDTNPVEVVGDNPEPVATGNEIRVWGYSDADDPTKLLARAMPDEVRAMLSVEKTVDVTI